MSFGIDGINDTLKEAIDTIMVPQSNVLDSTPLLFASASNRGLNISKPSYPASDSRVICVYALNGNGYNSSSLNPPATDSVNLGTLGDVVGVRWNHQDEFRSGTSYATPILAAITANYLAWLNHYDNELCGMKKYLREKYHIEWFLEDYMSTKVPGSKILFIKPENEKGFSIGQYETMAVTKAVEETDKRILGILNHKLGQISP